MPDTILVVDDEKYIREEICEALDDYNYISIEAENVNDALELLSSNRDVKVVIVDLKMPGHFNGIDLIHESKKITNEKRFVEYIVLTGHGEIEDAVAAMRLNAFDFLRKPVDIELLMRTVDNAVQSSIQQCNRYINDIQQISEITAKTHAISSLLSNLDHTDNQVLEAFLRSMSNKDDETEMHSRRIGIYSSLFARQLQWSDDRVSCISTAAMLHDIGKTGVPDQLLKKSGRLLTEDVDIMKQHAEIGYRILSVIDEPIMQMASLIAKSHHERWDGTGYPEGLCGHDIPIEARIVSLVDVYDALRSKRPYKEAFDHEKSISIILEGDGRVMPSHFDPELIEIFSRKHNELDEIYTSNIDIE